jgi:hypothetical protein
MPQRATYAVKNPMLNALDALFDAGVLEIRSGPQPAEAKAAPTGTLLWTETLPADAFANASAGAKVKNGTWQANAVATGQAGWFRLKQAADANGVSETEERIDGSVSLVGQGGQLTLNDLNIVSGASVEVVTCYLSLA